VSRSWTPRVRPSAKTCRERWSCAPIVQPQTPRVTDRNCGKVQASTVGPRRKRLATASTIVRHATKSIVSAARNATGVMLNTKPSAFHRSTWPVQRQRALAEKEHHRWGHVLRAAARLWNSTAASLLLVAGFWADTYSGAFGRQKLPGAIAVIQCHCCPIRERQRPVRHRDHRALGTRYS